jgi:hypothetical protein
VKPVQARHVRSTTSQTLTNALAKALRPFVGKTASKALVSVMGKRTALYVRGARSTMSRLATQQYITALEGAKPLKPTKLTRFDDAVWLQSLEKKILPDPDAVEVTVTEDHVAEIQRAGEHWALDAERGTLIDYAMRDKRFEGWARIDPEPPTCPFCTVLISIGPKRSDPTKAHFHAGDTCEVVLVKKGQTDYEGADQVKAAESKYKQAVRLNGGKTDLAGLVKQLKTIDPEGQTIS